MAIGNTRILLAACALALAPAAIANADDDSGDESGGASRGSRDRIRIEARGEPKSAFKVLPFVEDEEESSAKPERLPPSRAPKSKAERSASRPAPKSSFQPRFKDPVVRKVEHTEPVERDQRQEPSRGESRAEARPAHEIEGEVGGKALIDQAFAKSKAAETEDDYTHVIGLCRRGIDAGLKKNFEQYARELMAWAHNRRGESRAEAGRDADALADFESAVELNKNSWRAVHNRGVSYAGIGRLKEARADFNRTIDLKPDYANAYFNRGELSAAEGDFPHALGDYTESLRIHSRDAAVLSSRGRAFYQLHQLTDALADYGEALKLDPDHAPALVNRGEVYADLGKFGDAARDFRTAIRVDPDFGRAYQAAGWLMATCPDSHYRSEKLAIEAAKKAIDLDGEEDYKYLETLAAAQANAGLFADAKETEEKAIAKAPQNELVACEKRMSLYQRELSFQQRPIAMRETYDRDVRQASATQPADPRPRSRPPQRGPRPRGAPNPSRPQMRY